MTKVKTNFTLDYILIYLFPIILLNIVLIPIIELTRKSSLVGNLATL